VLLLLSERFDRSVDWILKEKGTSLGGEIRTVGGRIYKGPTSRTRLLIPVCHPLESALAVLIVAAEKYRAISQVVLVEVEGATISQQSVTQAALRAISATAKPQMLRMAKPG
jgi:cytidine/deoxycytidylate deaminase-like protein